MQRWANGRSYEGVNKLLGKIPHVHDATTLLRKLQMVRIETSGNAGRGREGREFVVLVGICLARGRGGVCCEWRGVGPPDGFWSGARDFLAQLPG